MIAKDFIAKAIDIACNFKTLYVMGCFGAPMNASNKTRYCQNHEYNKDPARQAMIQGASEDTFGFDCVCLVKGILWGWCGDTSQTYGGAKYATNSVPDLSADSMILRCNQVSSDFTNIQPGEFVWMKGHCGIYIGEGQVVESTPKWDNCVQITNVANLGRKTGKYRTWTSHGKLPWVDYTTVDSNDPNAPSDWARDSWNKLIAVGATDGTRPHDPCTREELAVILNKLELI